MGDIMIFFLNADSRGEFVLLLDAAILQLRLYYSIDYERAYATNVKTRLW